MSLFDKIFGGAKQPQNVGQFFQTLTAYTPTFTTWQGGVYESELVRAAIDARARHISKLTVEVNGPGQPTLKTKLKKSPNDFQTWSQFLYRLSTILDVNNTAFIVPISNEQGKLCGYFPVLPDQCKVVQYWGEPWLQYTFTTGETASVEFSKCGVMTKFQYCSDLFGEDNAALRPTMDLVNIQNQGIKEGVKSSATFRFAATLDNWATDEDLEKERKRFNRTNFEKEGGGVLLFPNTYKDWKQVESKPFVIDAEQMKAIQTNVYNYFGVNEAVLQNKAFGDEWTAFYEGAIEPFAIQMSEVLTRMSFNEHELGYGSYIMATANRLQYMSNADKLNVSAQMADRGLMTRNEIREIWNMPPLPPEIGEQLPVRGEYYNLGETDTKEDGTDGES